MKKIVPFLIVAATVALIVYGIKVTKENQYNWQKPGYQSAQK
jgi:hypothetical protein